MSQQSSPTDNEKKKAEELKTALKYWALLDLMEQGDFPKAVTKPKRSNYRDNDSDTDCVKGYFNNCLHIVLDNETDETPIITYAESKMNESEKKWTNKEIQLHLGCIPRDVLTQLSIDNLAKEDEGEGDSGSVEKKAVCEDLSFKSVSMSVITLKADGSFDKFRLSPLLWCAYYLNQGQSRPIDKIRESYEKEESIITDQIINKPADRKRTEKESAGQERAGRSPNSGDDNDCGLSCGDVKTIIDLLLKSECFKFIESKVADYQNQHKGKPNIHDVRTCALVVHADSEVEQSNEGTNASSGDFSFGLSFYHNDLVCVQEAIGKAIKAGQSLDTLRKGPLSLVIDYLLGGFREEKQNRIDLFCANYEKDVEHDEDPRLGYFSKCLSYWNLPLGRWPSKYSPTLMQQVAINQVAGRLNQRYEAEGPLHERGAFPANDIVSVNGPPGTGKTTLLKDIIAANIVEKARILATVDEPDALFEEIQLDEKPDGYLRYAPKMYRIKQEYDAINDLSIVLCSTNNTAVENISKELPDGKKFFEGLLDNEKGIFQGANKNCELHKLARSGSKGDEKSKIDADLYFSYAAVAQFAKSGKEAATKASLRVDPQAPGMLIAARLGKKGNIKTFRDESLKKVTRASDTNKNHAHFGKYKNARDLFNEQYDLVESMFKQRALASDIEDLEASLKAVEEKEQSIQDGVTASEGAFLEAVASCARKAGFLCCPNSLEDIKDFEKRLINDRSARDEISAAEAEVEKYSNEKHGLLDWLARRKRKDANEKLRECRRSYKDSLILEVSEDGKSHILNICEKYRQRLIAVGEKESELLKEKGAIYKQLDDLKKQLCDFENKAKETEGEKALRRVDSALLEGIDSQCDDTQLFNPAPIPNLDSFGTNEDATLSKARDILFLRALQVTREFVLASKCVKFNLTNLGAIWGAKETPKGNDEGEEVIVYDQRHIAEVMPSLLQTLGIVTPIISTTFSSIRTVFKDVPIADSGKAPFGLLIVDEAGQAVPQAAIGAFARCRRAMVVGDPRQIPPVVTSELSAVRTRMKKQLECSGGYFLSCEASVQRFADEANSVGSMRETLNGEGELWVGCPLVVHRRCLSPMFDISNQISYGESMINKTAEPSSNLNRFYSDCSQWINVPGSEAGKGNYFVEEQGACAAKIVFEAFEKNADENAGIPNLYVITPFKSVVSGFQEYLKQEYAKKYEAGSSKSNAVKKEAFDEFIKRNVGTVHSFQGKEANEVIFMLGCDSDSSGAVSWVSANIVNVAASRAKYRLYVIGDSRVWKSNAVVAQMRDILIDHWAHHFEVDELISHCASCDDVNESALEIDDEVFAPVKNSLKESIGATLTDGVYKKFGFEGGKADFEREFGKLAAADGTNRIADYLRTGMFLYEAFSLGADENRDGVVQSFCGINFCGALELYLQQLCLPLLKSLRSNNIKGCDNPSLARYKNGIKEKEVKKRLADLYGRFIQVDEQAESSPCGDGSITDATFAAGEKNDCTPDQEGWWTTFSSHIGSAGKVRGPIAHPGKQTSLTTGKATRYLVAWLLNPAFANGENEDLAPKSEDEAILKTSGILLAVQSALSDERSDEQQGSDEVAKAVAADESGAEVACAPSVVQGDQCVIVESEDVGLDAVRPESLLSITMWVKKWLKEGQVDKKPSAEQINQWLSERGLLEKPGKTYEVNQETRAKLQLPESQFGKHPKYGSPIFGAVAAEYILKVVKDKLSSNEKD